MSNEELTKEIEENYYECPYCHVTFDTSEERDSHVFDCHMPEVEEGLNEISKIAEDNRESLESWKQKKRIEILKEIARTRPQLLHEIQTSPHSEEMLNKMVEESLFKEALRTNTLSSFDAMWLRHPKFEEVYEAEKKQKESPEIYKNLDYKPEEQDSEEKLSEDDRHRKELLLILTSLMRKQKKEVH